jgi:hypothetical protein
MTVVISLREFVDEMQMVSSEIHAYLNQVTGGWERSSRMGTGRTPPGDGNPEFWGLPGASISI